MLEFIGELVARLIVLIVLLPLYLLLVTPVVLIAAPFHQGGVKGGYAAALEFWGALWP